MSLYLTVFCHSETRKSKPSRIRWFEKSNSNEKSPLWMEQSFCLSNLSQGETKADLRQSGFSLLLLYLSFSLSVTWSSILVLFYISYVCKTWIPNLDFSFVPSKFLRAKRLRISPPLCLSTFLILKLTKECRAPPLVLLPACANL